MSDRGRGKGRVSGDKSARTRGQAPRGTSKKPTGAPAANPDATVFMPADSLPGLDRPAGSDPPKPRRRREAQSSGAAAAPAPPVSNRPRSLGASNSFAPRADGVGIKVGDVLNNTFEVKRFIGRGGMGEVFEGINLHTDERVAIKVILPGLAADEHVVNMFRREAKTLTRLQHEALVQYRVLTQEPHLGVLYIVTEYIDGVSLADLYGKLNPTPERLVVLLRRLASGLRAAHMLGAVHRDLSPDNVLLEGGRLEMAKVIDFGIAKDVTPGSATVIGLGFAGKLEYVAPEQLGDFSGQVGPAADVYSLALVIMAVANGRGARMGGTIADAIDKRRKGPDLAGVPATLRPLLEKMLRADPAKRLPSMDAVLAELDKLVVVRKARIWPLAVGGAAAALAVLLAIVWWGLTPWVPAGAPSPKPSANASSAPASLPADRVEAAVAGINALLRDVDCTWLDIDNAGMGDVGPVVRLVGVADNRGKAQDKLYQLMAEKGLRNVQIETGNIGEINPRACEALNAYRQIRSTEPSRVMAHQLVFSMRMQPANALFHGQMAANLVYDFRTDQVAPELALAAFNTPGDVQLFIASRADLAKTLQQPKGPLDDLGDGRYRLKVDTVNRGWIGLLLLSSKTPMDPRVIAPTDPSGIADAAWRDRFVAEAKQQGWRADMLWLKAGEVPK